jgi:hypothetical protein
MGAPKPALQLTASREMVWFLTVIPGALAQLMGNPLGGGAVPKPVTPAILPLHRDHLVLEKQL